MTSSHVDLAETVIARTLRVPAPDARADDGAAAARQLDVALMSVGFKCSADLVERLSALDPVAVFDTGAIVLRAVRHLVGDHVDHNPYFIDFPRNVPDTIEFWLGLVADTLAAPSDDRVAPTDEIVSGGALNLLALNRYGRYQHTYADLVAAHGPFVESADDRVTVLHPGRALHEETHALYLQMAASPVPLHESDLELLAQLAAEHADDQQPDRIDVRENRAVVNRARLDRDLPLLVDAPTDVLRVACAASGGDVTLSAPTKLRSMSRRHRRALLAALDAVLQDTPAKIADVRRHPEAFKRLGERLHPHEHPRWPHAQNAFAVARGDVEARTPHARAEAAFAAGDPARAIDALKAAPGSLVRNVDRLVRAGADPGSVCDQVRNAAPLVSARVLLSLREHLSNRHAPSPARTFVNQQGRAWVTRDTRPALDDDVSAELRAALDAEIGRRLPRPGLLIVDPAVRTVALPLSDKTRPSGLGVLPRGSSMPAGCHVRFFVYWKQNARRTDYDLSVLLLDRDFRDVGHVSFTNLRENGIRHSGDIVDAPDGATELIDIDLASVDAHYVVPQVNVYCGERFDEAAEAFFGFMRLDGDQSGMPFEPRTVRAKSDLYGTGRVSLPLAFARGQHDDEWTAKWMHLNMRGYPQFNAVEGNHRDTSLLARVVAERDYLTVGYLEALMRANGTPVIDDPAQIAPGQDPVMYVGLERPEGLPDGSTVFTPANLAGLLNST